MTTLRRPPAFQEYASDMAAMEEVRLMTLAERGLLISMKWACWSSSTGTIPADPAQLALVLGLGESEVRAARTPAVLSFFAPVDVKGFGERLECPELSAQMARMMERREAQSRAAEETNAKRSANRGAKRDGKRHAPEKSRTEKNRTEKSASQGSNQLTDAHREFVAAMERAE